MPEEPDHAEIARSLMNNATAAATADLRDEYLKRAIFHMERARLSASIRTLLCAMKKEADR